MNTFHNKSLYPLFIFLLVLFVYIFFAGRLNFTFPTHAANYFSHLIFSFLNGRLDLINPTWTSDLSLFKDKLYMYWGPTPILLIWPFIVLFGINFSDAFYTAFIGSFGILFFYLIFNQLNKQKITNLSIAKKYLLCIFFAFGTVHFYLAVNGSIWFTSQVISTLYIIIALYLIFLFLNTNKVFYLLFSSFFFGLAVWGRLSFIFYLPFFITLNSLNCFNNKDYLKHFIRNSFYFVIILGFFAIIAGIYNFQRFGSFFETGHSFHNIAAKLSTERNRYGTFSLWYIPKNYYYAFLNVPSVTEKFPYFKFDTEGNSIFFTSSFFLLLLFLLRKRFWDSKKMIFFNSSILVSLSFIVFFLLIYFSTGWMQFGYRYSLDFIPLLLILLAEIISSISLKLLLIFIFFSIVINTLGTLWYLNL